MTAGGTITTVAGTGTSGYSGDGGPAINAQLNFPQGVAADGSGNVYVADTNNYRIPKVTPAGTISTFAGTGVYGSSGDGGPAASAQLRYPQGVAVIFPATCTLPIRAMAGSPGDPFPQLSLRWPATALTTTHRMVASPPQ